MHTPRLSRRRALGVAAALAAASCGMRASAEGAITRIGYGDHPSQFAELTLPSGDGSAPVVVVVHGGYWTAGYGLELGRPLAADLANRGYAALNVEYRRVGDGGGWPQTGDDVAAAVDSLAGRPRIDVKHVVGLGHSAGGQLAGWLAGRRGAAVPLTGAVLQAGVLDLVAGSRAGLGGGAIDAFLGGSPTERPDAYADASPTARAPLGVPTVAIHGTRDTVVPIAQSQAFVDAARKAGDRTELQTFDGDHFELTSVGSPAWALCVAAVARLAGR